MALLVKICGLSTPEALDAALDAGADMGGFVFFRPSPRNISLETARALSARVKDRAEKVALTVDADDLVLARIIDAQQPDVLQLHGHETPERFAAIKELFAFPVRRALAIGRQSDLAAIRSYRHIADRLLFEAG